MGVDGVEVGVFDGDVEAAGSVVEFDVFSGDGVEVVFEDGEVVVVEEVAGVFGDSVVLVALVSVVEAFGVCGLLDGFDGEDSAVV